MNVIFLAKLSSLRGLISDHLSHRLLLFDQLEISHLCRDLLSHGGCWSGSEIGVVFHIINGHVLQLVATVPRHSGGWPVHGHPYFQNEQVFEHHDVSAGSVVRGVQVAVVLWFNWTFENFLMFWVNYVRLVVSLNCGGPRWRPYQVLV